MRKTGRGASKDKERMTETASLESSKLKKDGTYTNNTGRVTQKARAKADKKTRKGKSQEQANLETKEKGTKSK